MIVVEVVAKADAHSDLTHDHDNAGGNEEETASHTIDSNDGYQCRHHIHCIVKQPVKNMLQM